MFSNGKVEKKEQLIKQVNDIKINGSTNISLGLKTSFDLLQDNERIVPRKMFLFR